MAAPGKKPGLMLAMLGGGKSVAPPAKDSEPVADDSFDSAAQNVFDAVAENDVAGFKLALKAAILAASDEDTAPDFE